MKAKGREGDDSTVEVHTASSKSSERQQYQDAQAMFRSRLRTPRPLFAMERGGTGKRRIVRMLSLEVPCRGGWVGFLEDRARRLGT